MRTLAALVLLATLALPISSASADADLFALARGEVLDPWSVLEAQQHYSSSAPVPPARIYRDVKPACDLDGDTVADVLVNNLTLAAAPSHNSARSEIEALSAVTGERIWKVDNLLVARLPAPASVPYSGRGQPFPDGEPSMQPTLDVDGDGTCDVIAYGFDGLAGYAVPIVGQPSVRNVAFTLRALSGASGEPLWSLDSVATTTTASEPLFGTVQNVVTRGFPTGVLAYSTDAGPRVLVKFTDLRYHTADLPVSLAPVPTLDPRKDLLKGPLHYEDVRITERIRLLDAATGELLWERALGSEDTSAEIDARFTNLTWITGVADLGGDEPAILLDQLIVSTPRTSEANHPVTGDTLFGYGRGAVVTLLDGASGATLWAATTRDAFPAEANARDEENFETLAWTRSSVTPDIDGDGVPEVLASYTAREESLTTTILGAYRTHFIPLSGANGTALWDVRQQGWGVARPIGGGFLGLGMLDVPAPPLVEGAPVPPRHVRLLAVEAATGDAMWSYERNSAQSSPLSYNLALAQFHEALAPFDLDGDGILDLLTPAEETPRTGRDQVLLATSSHSYSVLSGATGRSLGSIRAWGPDGRVVPCPGAEGSLTVLSGHARRLELARFDAATGERAWRHVIHNDPTPRAASAAMDATAIGAACLSSADGLLFSVDLQAFSFERRHEVVPILGRLDGDADIAWMTPALRGSPPSDAIFQASIREDAPSTGALWATAGVAAATGLVAAFATVALLARAGSRLLAVGLVLILLAPGAVGVGLPSPQTALPALAPPSPEALPDRIDDLSLREALAAEVAATRARASGSADNASLARFEADGTVSFTLDVGDVDGDGFDDLAFDQYCVYSDPCFSGVGIPEGLTQLVTGWDCGYQHDLAVVSGANGSILWTMDLSIQGSINQCGEHVVIGTLQAGEETAILVLRHHFLHWTFFRLNGVVVSDIIALSAASGERLWTHTTPGAYSSDFVGSMSAKDVVAMPIIAREGDAEALYVRGVGWSTSGADTFFPIAPGYPLTSRPVTTHDVHVPNEWLARLDPATGLEEWRRDTFSPTPARNARVYAMSMELEEAAFSGTWLREADYWATRPCCGDVTGDGVPDVAFTVYEWAQTPMAKVAQPSGLDARLVIFDGASGEVHLDEQVAADMPTTIENVYDQRRNYILGINFGEFLSRAEHEPVGDVDGDGAHDILTHVTVRDPEFRRNVTVRSGATGEILWTRETARDLRPLVLGDADGDGGDDMLLLDWYGHEGPGGEMWDDFVVPQAVPLDLVSGRTGETLWTRVSYSAPADILESYKSMHRNGVPDVDGDGVGDVFLDDPIYLDDQTVVHRVSVVSGRDARPIATHTTVGAFAIPTSAQDLDGDGRDEVAILNGDVNDLWLTVYDGATGEAEFSRRILALPASGHARVLPFLKLDALDRPGGPTLAITFHVDILRSYAYWGLCFGTGCDSSEAGERIGTWTYWTSQVLLAKTSDGALEWALPKLDAFDAAARVLGPTPGVLAFAKVEERASSIGLLAAGAREARPYALPAIAGFGLAYALALAAGIAIVRFRSRFTGVPELD